MGGKGGLSNSVQQDLAQNSSALVSLAQGQSANANQLFQTAFPGFSQAESFYSAMASGDPGLIAKTISPAAQQVNMAATGERQNIMNTTPVGGERNLALEQSFLNQGAQVGNLGASGYLSAQNSLAQLAGQGINQSISSAGTGISGYNSANSALGQLGNLQIQQKGAQLGALTSLGQDAATVGSAAFL